MRGRITVLDDALREQLAEHIAAKGLIRKACKHFGIPYRLFHSTRKIDPEFDEEIKEALEEFKETIQEELIRRAVTGYEAPIYKNGEFVGMETKYSDGLLQTLIKAKDDQFKDKVQVDAVVTGGVLAVMAAPQTAQDWLAAHNNGAPQLPAAPEEGVVDADVVEHTTDTVKR